MDIALFSLKEGIPCHAPCIRLCVDDSAATNGAPWGTGTRRRTHGTHSRVPSEQWTIVAVYGVQSVIWVTRQLNDS